ncbi:MAG: PilZ domain-containing protein [Planctomycetota bacterium]
MDHDCSYDIVITKLPAKPLTGDELRALNDKLAVDMPKSDLLVDLGAVIEPTCKSIDTLKALSDVLSQRGRCCMFYNLTMATKRTFHQHGLDKVFHILEASDVVLKPSAEHMSRGILELHGSKERRKYIRLRVPSWLRVDVLIWHGGRKDDYHKMLPGHSWPGRLIDISEGGMQVAISTTEAATLGKGRLVGIEFRPYHAESALTFDAWIIEILPTADGRNICLGLQFIALEANPQGRQGLARLCSSGGTNYEAKKNTVV